MKAADFINLVNSMDCEEFSDVPESDVELVTSRVNETWAFDETYSTSMNVYECEDGLVGVIGVCHLDSAYFDRNPDCLKRLPHCIACKVEPAIIQTYVPCMTI